MSTPSERAPQGAAQTASPRANGRRRRVVLSTLFLVFAAAGLVVAAYWVLIGQYRVTSDDAYVQGNVVQVTPQVAGTVVSIAADNTDEAIHWTALTAPASYIIGSIASYWMIDRIAGFWTL